MTKRDTGDHRDQPKSSADRWCYIIEHNFHFSVASCIDANSYTLSCKSVSNRWTNRRPNPANAISWLCTYSYTGCRCHAIGDTHRCSVDHGR